MNETSINTATNTAVLSINTPNDTAVSSSNTPAPTSIYNVIPLPRELLDLCRNDDAARQDFFTTTIQTICKEMMENAQAGRTQHVFFLDNKETEITQDVLQAFRAQGYNVDCRVLQTDAFIIINRTDLYFSWYPDESPVLSSYSQEKFVEEEKTSYLQPPPNCILPAEELFKISLDKDARRDKVRQQALDGMLSEIRNAAKEGKTQEELSLYDEEVDLVREFRKEFEKRGYVCHTLVRQGVCSSGRREAKLFLSWDATIPLKIPTYYSTKRPYIPT